MCESVSQVCVWWWCVCESVMCVVKVWVCGGCECESGVVLCVCV